MKEKEEKEFTSAIIDNYTGEVLNEIYSGDKVIIQRGESIEFLQSHTKINKKKDFSFLYISASEILCKESLTPNENRIIWGIQKHIEFSSGILKMLCGRNPDKKLNAKDIIKICDMNDKTFYRAMDGLIKKKIIGKTTVGKETNYIVNPFIFYRGNCKGGGYIPKTTYELFKNSKWNTNNE